LHYYYNDDGLDNGQTIAITSSMQSYLTF